ncbi:MAG: hypothetical protein JF597_00305 [Streptomyces sp.]|nr:hypothetical protein [Streptomyces sp.]MBW8792087.1 hypothetical protein [Streptomyces sp.]
MVAGAQQDGAIRSDPSPADTTTLISEAPYAIARARPASRQLTDVCLAVLMNGLRPPSERPGMP